MLGGLLFYRAQRKLKVPGVGSDEESNSDSDEGGSVISLNLGNSSGEASQSGRSMSSLVFCQLPVEPSSSPCELSSPCCVPRLGAASEEEIIRLQNRLTSLNGEMESLRQLISQKDNRIKSLEVPGPFLYIRLSSCIPLTPPFWYCLALSVRLGCSKKWWFHHFERLVVILQRPRCRQ